MADRKHANLNEAGESVISTTVDANASRNENTDSQEALAKDREVVKGIMQFRRWDDDEDSNNASPYTSREPPSERLFNPEAPKLLDDELLHADTIGNTVYSKHWLFDTLMKLIQVSCSCN